ncbi:MAG: hypothetical protein ACI88H_001340 [Cocleimonas sp.]|jgi:hypothetical protein
MKKSTGSCLCGEVHYEITGSLGVFQYCHCSRCRKFTGSAHAANIIVAPNQFEWLQGEEFLARYEVPDARHFATSFCTQCGSSLPWKSQSDKAVIIPAGTLDDDPDIRPFQNIFYGSKADWYQDASELIKYDELPTKKS